MIGPLCMCIVGKVKLDREMGVGLCVNERRKHDAQGE